jgi:Fe2+ transport system protein FeoA
MSKTHTPLSLNTIKLHTVATIHSVQAIPNTNKTDAQSIRIVERLQETGFLPGEQIELIHRGIGKKPNLVIRLGGYSDFALRAQEAAYIQLSPITT